MTKQLLRKVVKKLRADRDPAINADQALQLVLREYEFNTVLDIGSGSGVHKKVFEEHGKAVTAVDFGTSVYFQAPSYQRSQQVVRVDYLEHEFADKFDLVWASHVLEHQVNPNLFLRKIFDDLDDGGLLAITVPPLKHEIVGGHVTLWNAGLLLYQLVLAGFNCKNPRIKTYGYNVSVILEKQPISLPVLDNDSGDITRLRKFLPSFATEGFNGQIKEFNWSRRVS